MGVIIMKEPSYCGDPSCWCVSYPNGEEHFLCEACRKPLVEADIEDNMSLCNACQSSLQD
jgi:hypothetical protein